MGLCSLSAPTAWREPVVVATIVVGVDGSRRSKDALRWAAHEAELTGATLELVMAWQPLNPDAWIPHDRSFRDGLAMTQQYLERITAEVFEDFPEAKYEAHAVEGPAAKALVQASRHAALVVVGNRGRSGFAGLLLGSVSLHCVLHAHCPVVEVRDSNAAAA